MLHVEPERFWAKVETAEKGCWRWRGSKNKKGYGTIQSRQAIPQLAHRVSWSLCVGVVPDGAWVLHHCDEPSCVRPSHLFLGDHAANMKDMSSKGRHFSKTKPERLRRGDEHYYRLRPQEVRRGTEIGNAVLDESAVRAIRAGRLAGRTVQDLADTFGIGKSQVSRIARGRSWSHVT